MGLNPSEREAFARALRVRMAELPDLTSNDLAAAVGCHPNGIYQLRCGRRGPSAELLVRLARAIAVEPTRLVPPDRWPRLQGATRLDPAVAMRRLPAPDASHGQATRAGEQDRALATRRLAARLVAALAIVEETIERLRPRRDRLPVWGRELIGVGEALRDAGVAAVDLREAAAELEGVL